MMRTKVVGKTRVNNVNPNIQKSRHMTKKVKRLNSRIQRLCGEKGAPLMAFITISQTGQISIVGSPSLCETVKGMKGEDLINLAKPAVEKAVSVSTEKIVNLKHIDTSIDWEDVNVFMCRQAYSQICTVKGKGERTTYNEENRPEFWPTGIPYCSHSTMRADGKGRVLDANSIRRVLKAFSSYCLSKINEGYKPINNIQTVEKLRVIAERSDSHTPPEKKMRISEDVEDEYDEDSDTEQYVGSPISLMSDIDEDPMSDLNEDPMSDLDEDPLKDALSKRDYEEVIGIVNSKWPLSDESIEQIEFMLATERPLQMDCVPINESVRVSYNGPSGFSLGKGFRNVWELFHPNPEVARLKVFLFGMKHMTHYVSQYEQLGTSVHRVKMALNPSSEQLDHAAILTEEAKKILVDQHVETIGYMFLAGALNSQVDIFTPKKKDSFPGCPCAGNEMIQSIYIDRRDNVYGLSPSSIWKGRKSNMGRSKATPQTVNRTRRAQLPGSDGPVICGYGHEIWQSAVDRVAKKEWLDDSVVNFMLSHAKRTSNNEKVCVLEAMFAYSLLVPEKLAISRGKVPMDGYNSKAADKYANSVTRKVDLVLIPICNNVHWFLAALYAKTGKMHILCSMGCTYLAAEMGLKRYFTEKLEMAITISHPKVPLQTNSRDCGVFVIEYGVSLIMARNSEPDWHNLGEGGNRKKLLNQIQELMKSCS